MTGKDLRDFLNDGKRAYGSLIVNNSPRFVGAAKSIGLDYVFIDTEHISLSRQDLYWMCEGYASAGIPPIVRIPNHDPNFATMAIDAGASGVMVPYVEEVSQVEELVKAVKLRPYKGVKAEQILRDRTSVSQKTQDYIEEFNKNHILLINIESKRAVENLENLLAVDGVDGIIIGPHDLSCSYEMPEEYHSQEFVDLVSSILKKTRECGKWAGIHQTSNNMQSIKKWCNDGANIVLHKADIIAFVEKLTDDIAEIKKSVDGLDSSTERENINI
ncbi:MAG: aldolase/citrate lyase family protein [Spirochaetales bacterium]|nr:aldolase/citrate lyase family protein [Spirochaetales bacterium]